MSAVIELGSVDPSSFSNPDEVIINHIKIFWDIDFEKKILDGKVELTVEKNPESPVNFLVLDTRDLTIKKVSDVTTGSELSYHLGAAKKTFGCYLKIELPVKVAEPEKPAVEPEIFQIAVEYETSNQASALQWLTAEQTAGKEQPYLFSQCQAIHCRSIIPCQDTPYVKCPYTAEVTAPKALTVLMSAIQDGPAVPTAAKGKMVHKFNQTNPIPSYLIAIACGRLQGKRLGLRSTLWTEPELMQECLYEFQQTDEMLKAAEKICGPYEWGKYDLLVLPPSFPFGGMENPCLTFVTPTLLIKTFGEKNPLTCLVQNLKGIDPDDAFSIVPYEKGHTFIFYLEELMGGPGEFNVFLKNYFETFKFKSITTADFKTFFCGFFKEKKEELKQIDWDAWLHSPGMPPIIPKYDQTQLKATLALVEKWASWTPTEDCLFGNSIFNKDDVGKLSSAQVILFYGTLLEMAPLDLLKIKLMHKVYQLEDVKNSEIRFRWLRVCIKARWEECIPKALQFVNEQGRMKFVRPIYRDLYDWEHARPKAIDNYHKNKISMMFVLAHQLEKDLHLIKS